MVLSNSLTLVALLVYSSFIKEIRDCVFMPDKRSFYGLWEYVKIAIPAILMACADWWVF